jgi:hypothetical protein
MASEEWGPLAGLIGEWEGEKGVDVAFSHAHGDAIETPCREQLSLQPFGPVVNGEQHLHGLDYRSAMWRGEDDLPFHTEVGYLLWDASTGEVLRAFVVPRGIAVLAGGTAAADATTFTVTARQGEGPYRIGENTYLAANASTISFEMTVTVHDDTSFSYEERTMLRLKDAEEPFAHTDRGRLRRVG